VVVSNNLGFICTQAHSRTECIMHKDRHAHSRRQRTDTQATKVDVKICDRGPTWGR